MQENWWTHWSNPTTSSIIANEVKSGMASWPYHFWDNLVFESPSVSNPSLMENLSTCKAVLSGLTG
ncbi:hypothetical protein KTT_08160 [Tengunoibacter tsumagoiensis]|uniref:Uncharacterized protein n=1 Tax=Tengunoibacter tsumagoiensis TaxID=2014871 RepID=A0A401ZVT7_9CHLR|nr:hypothetical protein KTT_08160 [Tengunoibacter tsumagoiensis]